MTTVSLIRGCQLFCLVECLVLINFTSAMRITSFKGTYSEHELRQYWKRKLPIDNEVISDGAHPRTSVRGGNWRIADGSIFRSYWNVPNFCGEQFGISLPLSDYGIEYNSDNLRSGGNVVNVFGHTQIGYYPYVNRTTQLFVNGGLPQLANITAHLEKATSDLLAVIPDPDFDGIGVLDWEQWYPQWNATFILYRALSIAHVRSQHPEWDNATITRVAALEWTQGAKLFMESTLKLALQLRPRATWGFYHYPYCNTRGGNNSACVQGTNLNDELMWLFNEATVMYPSIYLKPDERYQESSVNARLTEAFRVRDKSVDPKGVVLSYTRFNYSSTGFYYSLEDLNATILKSAEFGTHGLVFWGDAYDEKTARSCQELRDYIMTSLGPTLLMARQGAEQCSERVCSGHGRCVGKILTCEKGVSPRGRRKGRMYVKDPWGDVCSCRCFRGWDGSDCSKTSKH